MYNTMAVQPILGAPVVDPLAASVMLGGVNPLVASGVIL